MTQKASYALAHAEARKTIPCAVSHSAVERGIWIRLCFLADIERQDQDTRHSLSLSPCDLGEMRCSRLPLAVYQGMRAYMTLKLLADLVTYSRARLLVTKQCCSHRAASS